MRTPTGARFSSVTDEYGRKEFFKGFFKRLNKLLVSNYGTNEAKSILQSLSTNSIIIKNPEIFFSQADSFCEPSIRPFNNQKNLNDFFCATLMNCLKLKQEGLDRIELLWFFIYASVVISDWKIKNKLSKAKTTECFPQLQVLMDMFVSSLCGTYRKSQFIIRIVDKNIFQSVCKLSGFKNATVTTYAAVLAAFFASYDKLKKLSTDVNCPKIEMLLSVYKDARKNQEEYLACVFKTISPKVRKVTNNLSSLSQESLELDTALEYLKNTYNTSITDFGSIKAELRLIENKPWYVYNAHHPQYTSIDYDYFLPKSTLTTHNVKCIYMSLDNVKDIVQPPLVELEIPCKKLSLKGIDSRMDRATKLGLIKYREYIKRSYSQCCLKKGVIRITLKDLAPLNDDVISYIENRKRKIESLYNREIKVAYEFDEKECCTKFGSSYPTHIRIISDIHADINKDMNYHFDFGDDFVINCGDTSGDLNYTSGWVRTNMKTGFFTIGNHFGYNQPFPELNGPQNIAKWGCEVHENNTLNGQSKILAREFSVGDTVYVNENCHEYQGIYFLGAPLYTDFLLYGEDKKENMISYARMMMNDYRVTKAYSNCDLTLLGDNKVLVTKGKPRIFTPDPWFFIFKHASAMRFFTKKVRELQAEPVVIFTHHAPLPYSIDEKYKNSPLNAAFTSDLRYFLRKFSNIRLWCHGHVHSKFDYIYVRKCKDGTMSETRVVCNPFGYYTEYPDDPKDYGKRISIKDIKSTRKWTTILAKEIKAGEVKVYIDDED